MPSPAPAPALRILALDPWLGGSHLAFLENLREHSDHDIEIQGLPPRHWKWRMRGAAWQLARKLAEHPVPDALLVSDYLDLPAFFGHLPPAWAAVPCTLYFHENQLTYPAQDSSEKLDTSYGLINILSAVRADRVLFNSAFHRDEFGAAAIELLRQLPRPTPRSEFEHAMKGSAVVAPGVSVHSIPMGYGNPEGPLRILFPHRWEHDKDPLTFLEAMLEIEREHPEFELVLLGEHYAKLPSGVERCLEQLQARITHQGFLPDQQKYYEALGSCDLVVSTAQHEFFGMAVVEAMAAGVQPLLPERLSYPEVVGSDLARGSLYATDAELRERLIAWIKDPTALRGRDERQRLRQRAESWSTQATAQAIDAVLRESSRCPGLNP